MTLSVRFPDELIAVIPHLLGFKPEESLVFLPMSSELPAARVDLPTTPHDREVVWSSTRDAYVRHAQPGSSLAKAPLAPEYPASSAIRWATSATASISRASTPPTWSSTRSRARARRLHRRQTDDPAPDHCYLG